MKKIIFLILMFPTIVFANMQHQLQQLQQMQQMMQMAQLASCMKEVDQIVLKKLIKKGNLLKQKINSLCNAEKDYKAQKELINSANDINNNQHLRKMRICVNKIKLPMMQQKITDKFQIDTSQNICDLIVTQE